MLVSSLGPQHQSCSLLSSRGLAQGFVLPPAYWFLKGSHSGPKVGPQAAQGGAVWDTRLCLGTSAHFGARQQATLSGNRWALVLVTAWLEPEPRDRPQRGPRTAGSPPPGTHLARWEKGTQGSQLLTPLDIDAPRVQPRFLHRSTPHPPSPPGGCLKDWRQVLGYALQWEGEEWGYRGLSLPQQGAESHTGEEGHLLAARAPPAGFL